MTFLCGIWTAWGLDGRGTKRHSCGRLQVGPSSVVVQTSKSGMVWGRIVGVLLSKELTEDLISVSRKSDPMMSIELGLDEMRA